MTENTGTLAPETPAHVRDIAIRQIGPERCLAVWVEEDDSGHHVVWRTVEGADCGRARSVEAVVGYPTSPCPVAGHLVWAELDEEEGRLFHLPLSEHGLEEGLPRRISVPRAGRIDNPAAVVDRRGDVWVLAELWREDGSSLVLLRGREGIWFAEELVTSGHCVRPRLEATPGGLLASWDCHRDGGFRVVAADRRGGAWSCRTLPAPEGTRETLSEPAVGPDGERYVGRCRERPVELEGGACTFCSEIVVARSEPGLSEWRDTGTVNIDHGLNPWLGPYCGRRRFPHLVPDGNGAWVLWEEKVDPESMEVPDGRLCAVHLDASGQKDEPVSVVDGESCFVVARGAAPDGLAVVSRGRPERFVERYPAHLHRVELAAGLPARPEELATNEDAPDFVPPSTGPEDRPRDGEWRLFFGDPHLHSRFSGDLAGEQDEGYVFARDFARLDFVAFTENDFHHYAERLSDADWIRSRRNAGVFDEPGRFTAFRGYEFTGMTHPDSGEGRESHRCVLFPGSEAEIVPWYDGERVLEPADLAEFFRGRRVLLHHHHPMGYDVTDDSVERNIEVCSGWWNCMRIPEFVENLHRMLDEGHRLGFIGASDNHERNPGLGGALTGVWAEQNTREGLFEAMRARRTYATTGLRPVIRFDVSGTVMGSEGTTAGPPVVRLRARCEVPVELVRVIRDGQEVHRERPVSTEVELNWTDRQAQPGLHWFYVHVQFAVENAEVDWTEPMPLPWNTKPARGRDAWTSPVWVEREG